MDTRLILAGAVPAAIMAILADAMLGALEKPTAGASRGVVARGRGRHRRLGLRLFLHGGTKPVVVGSKNFTEQVLLGEILARLESSGFAVDRRLNLGGTSLCQAAVQSGQLDLYVEYTGTALTDVLKQPPSSDPAAVLATVRAGYAPLGLSVGEPLGFNNTFALVMRRGAAKTMGIARISDLARHAATIRVGLFGEFLERKDGMPGLLRATASDLRYHLGKWTWACSTSRSPKGRSTWSWAARRTGSLPHSISWSWKTTGTTSRPTRQCRS